MAPEGSFIFAEGGEIRARIGLHCYELVADEESCLEAVGNQEALHFTFAFPGGLSTVLGVQEPGSR